MRHPVAQNVLALGTVQVAVVVVPLVTLPILARVLDRSQLGLVVFVQTFSFLVALLVEYGFSLSATREVATNRDKAEALAGTVAGVQGAKLALTGLAVVLSAALLPVVPIFRHAPELLAYGLALGIAQGFLPVWFFLGTERSQIVALAELVSRMAALVLIVVFVNGAHDGELVLLIYLLSAGGSTALLTMIMRRRVPAARISLLETRGALARGRTLFAGTGATAFYTGANAFLLGLIVPPAHVAVFASGEKIVRAGNRVLALMASAVYPRVALLVSRGNVSRANRLSKLSFALFGGTAVAAAAVLVAFAPTIITVVFGKGFSSAVPLLRIIALILPLNVIGVVLSTQWLLPRGMDRRVSIVLLIACILNAVLLFVVTDLAGLKGTAWSLVVVELFVMTGNALGLRHLGAAERRVAL